MSARGDGASRADAAAESDEAAAICRLLAQRWGLLDLEVERVQDGMNGRVWLVRGPETDRFVKWVPDAALGSLRAGAEASSLAARSGVATGEAVPATGGDLVVVHAVDGVPGGLVLMRAVPGVPLGDGADGTDDADDDAAVVGATLARVHAPLVDAVAPGAIPWPWVDPDADHLRATAVEPALRDAVAAATAALDDLPPLVTGVCHGDPAPEAFLRAPDGSVGLVDWTSCVQGPLAFDVASAVMYVGGLAHAAPLLAAYAEVGGAAAVDVGRPGVLETMLRWRWAVQADYFARRIAVDDRTGLDDDPRGAEHANAGGLDDARRRLLGVVPL